MTITHLLEDFTRRDTDVGLDTSQAVLEEERLSAFEQGYQAGWDDSLKAAGGAERQLLEEISKALSDLGSCQNEVYRELLTNMRPVIGSLVEAVLPSVLKENLGIQLSSLIQDYVEKNGTAGIVVSIAKGQSDLLSDVTSILSNFSADIQEDAVLEPYQVRVSFAGKNEVEIDPEALMKQIKVSIESFFQDDVQTIRETR